MNLPLTAVELCAACEVDEPDGRDVVCVALTDDRPARQRRSYFVRMAECGETAAVLSATVDQATGEQTWRWHGKVPCSPADWFALRQDGIVSLPAAEIDRRGRMMSFDAVSAEELLREIQLLPDEFMRDRAVRISDKMDKIYGDSAKYWSRPLTSDVSSGMQDKHAA